MPELARFRGIIIRMYSEHGKHHLAHFHAYYSGRSAVFGIEPAVQIEGALPRQQAALVLEWATLHTQELRENRDRIQRGDPRVPIEPLH